MLRVLCLTILFQLFSGPSLYAKSVDCEILTRVKCPCPANSRMRCGEKQGYVANDTSLTHLKILITTSVGTQRYVTVEKPPGTMMDYVNVDKNEWVRKNIAGLKATDTLSVANRGYGIDDSTELFIDPRKERSKGTIAESSPSPIEICAYLDAKPKITIPSESCSQARCVGFVFCKLDDGGFKSQVVCPADAKGQCPSATDCARDEEISLYEPSNLELIPAYNSKTGKAIDR